jgi:hypothetical protein
MPTRKEDSEMAYMVLFKESDDWDQKWQVDSWYPANELGEARARKRSLKRMNSGWQVLIVEVMSE